MATSSQLFSAFRPSGVLVGNVPFAHEARGKRETFLAVPSARSVAIYKCSNLGMIQTLPPLPEPVTG
jgi:hypothetical protein